MHCMHDAEPRQQRPRRLRPPHPPADGCVDINHADCDELQRIIHIGLDRATQIINLRPFRSVSDRQGSNVYKTVEATRLSPLQAKASRSTSARPSPAGEAAARARRNETCRRAGLPDIDYGTAFATLERPENAVAPARTDGVAQTTVHGADRSQWSPATDALAQDPRRRPTSLPQPSWALHMQSEAIQPPHPIL